MQMVRSREGDQGILLDPGKYKEKGGGFNQTEQELYWRKCE